MKILQIVPAMDEGGVERGVVEMNRVIKGEGWENTVVAGGGRMLGDIVRDGGKAIAMDVKSKNPFTFFSRAFALRKILKNEKPDVATIHSRVPAWLFAFANRTLKIPSITFAHGANSVSRYSKIMTSGDIVATPSQYITDYLKANYDFDYSKIRTIPRAIDKSKFDVSRLDESFVEAKRAEWNLDGSFTIMGLGRITQLKGYDILIDALAVLKKRGATLRGRKPRVVIVGEAEERRADVAEALRERVLALGLEDDVVFAGNQSKVSECLSLADVVVSANVRKPEAFGRSMAEALAMGRPVVAKAFGGAVDVVRDGIDGVLVRGDAAPVECPELFADAIARAASLDTSGLRESALERFSFETMAARSLAVYREFMR